MSTIASCSSSPSPIVLQPEVKQQKMPADEKEKEQNQSASADQPKSSQIIQQKQPQPIASPHHLASPLIPLRQCRICLLSTESRRRPLLSPCRCAGSVQHVHVHCLAHWIEVSSRKLGPPPHCELCGFRYRRRPFIDFTRIHFPFMDLRDRVLNSLCLLLFIIMGLCAWVAVQHLQQTERRPQTLGRSSSAPSNRASRVALSQPDLTVLVACILMFAALFLAIFTQYRAEVSLFHAISRLWTTNRNWRIRNYCPAEGENNGKRRRRKLGNEKNAVGIGATTTTTLIMTNFFRAKI